ncbi:MAG: tRNA-dihydrouridine synthase family protein, partial [Kiritimatiellae bacterium]|nr:tRNA-dihydrouridine synthase family protein [Kiritimatiellia bacterium]
ALMRDPKKVETIVREVRSATKLPVTIKTRLGFSDREMNVSEVAHAAEAGGASAIALHCRTAAGRHGGTARWDILARIKAERRIPIIGNGGIVTAADALRMFRETGVDGVMIGRAAIGNPWIFREIGALLKGATAELCSPTERRAVIVEHFERLLVLKELERRYRRRDSLGSETAAAMQFRSHLLKYLAHVQGVGSLRRNLEKIRSRNDILRVLDELLPGAHETPAAFEKNATQ